VNEYSDDDAIVEELQPEGCEPIDPDWIVAIDHYRLLSVNVTVRSGSEVFSAALRRQLERFHNDKLEHESVTVDVFPIAPRQPGEDWYAFEQLGTGEQRPGLLEDLFNHCVWYINALVPKRAGDFLFLHAGAVVRNGSAVLLPAERDTGKSTTVAALLDGGYDYLSDELGAIDPITGRAYPFPKNLSFADDSLAFFPELAARLGDRSGDGPRLYQRTVRPEELGARVAGPSPVGAVVFLENDHEGPARLMPIAKAAAVKDMAANAFNLYRYEERGVVLLSRIAEEAKAFRLAGGTPRERATLIGERLST
jgi:hypothetical protein